MRNFMILLLAKYCCDDQRKRRDWHSLLYGLERREMLVGFSWAHVKEGNYLKATD
jgi:hypothetical protein